MDQICCTCKLKLPLTAFRNDSNRKNGKSIQCKPCRSVWYEANKETQRAKGRAWHKKNPERSKFNSWKFKLKKKFGLEAAEYQAMHDTQHGKCAICCQPSPNQALSVDHNHITGQIRALLCSKCNFAIGLFKEDVVRLESAIHYLKRWNQ